MDSLDRNLLIVASTLESTLFLTQGIFEMQDEQIALMHEQLALADEQAEGLRQQRDFAELEGPEKKAEVVKEEKEKDPKLKDGGDFAFGDILKALALAPFAFRFAKGFISAITDDMVEATAAGITGLAAMIRGDMNKLFKGIGKAFLAPFRGLQNFAAKSSKRIAKLVSRVEDGVSSVRTFFSNVGKRFSTIGKFLAKVGSVIGSTVGAIMDLPILRIIKTVLTRLALPLTLFMGAYEAVTSFMNTEGSFMEKFMAGVGGFFGEIIGAPLDLLKGAVAWILGKLGFDESADALSSFSFKQLIKDIFGGLFDAASSAVSVITDLFTFGEDDKGILGALGKFTDIVYAPVNMAINFVRGLFGFGEEEGGEPFKLQDFIAEKALAVINWFGGLFSWAAEGIAEGWTNLTSFVSGIWTGVKEWFAEKLGFSTDGEEGEGFSISDLFWSTIDKVKAFFTDLFDFIPSIADIKDALYAQLPGWAQKIVGGGSPEEAVSPEDAAAEAAEMREEGLARRREIESEIAEQEAQMAAGDNRTGFGRSRSRIVEDLKEELETLPQVESSRLDSEGMTPETAEVVEEEPRRMNRYERKQARMARMRDGDNVVVTKSQPDIVPTDNNRSLENRTIAVEQGSRTVSAAPAPVVVTGGNSARGGDTYNNGGNSSTTTIINTSSDPTRALRHVPI